MFIQPTSTGDFANLKTPIFTDTLYVRLAYCLQGLIEGILRDEHGTICRKMETEVNGSAQELTWDGLNDLPYGIYTLQLSQGLHELNARVVKRV